MLAGLNETQKNEICEFIDGMPILPNVIRDAVICGNGYWYPIGENVPEVKTVAYYLDQIYKENLVDLIKDVFEKVGIGSAFGYHPYWFEKQKRWIDIPDLKIFLYEKDEEGWKFPWICEEYYFDKSRSWIIYVSHEGTITFAGDTLAKTADEVIPTRFKLGTFHSS